MIGLATLLPVLFGTAFAHMQMYDPPPMGSKAAPVKDTANMNDYHGPLNAASGYNSYPCKGYPNMPEFGGVVDSWAAGSPQTFSIAGGAAHHGGSCQLSLSYDNGATWNVIHSIIGGCLVEGLDNLPFTVPAEAPSGKALFAWGWFNLQGNREMYHNCAVIDITNGGSGFTNIKDFPAPFVANAFGANSCSTVEGVEVVFPEPGKSIHYGGAYKGTQPQPGAGIVGSNCGHPGGTVSGGNSGGGGAPPVAEQASALLSSAPLAAPSSTGIATPPPPPVLAIPVPGPVGTSLSPPVSQPSAVAPPVGPTGTPSPAGKVCRRWRSGRPAGTLSTRKRSASRSRSDGISAGAHARAHAAKRGAALHGKGMMGRRV